MKELKEAEVWLESAKKALNTDIAKKEKSTQS